jgi:hypothetical protein
MVISAVSGAWSEHGREQLISELPACKHDDAERPLDRQRRELALQLARRINAAQQEAFEQTGRYYPVTQLAKLPAVPHGFRLTAYFDGDGYLFSLKDNVDPCHFGIFSDQLGRIYSATPGVPQLAGKGTERDQRSRQGHSGNE